MCENQVNLLDNLPFCTSIIGHCGTTEVGNECSLWPKEKVQKEPQTKPNKTRLYSSEKVLSYCSIQSIKDGERDLSDTNVFVYCTVGEI